MIATETLKLNLGGRGTKIPGFLTVDLSDEFDVDVKSDVSKLPYDDNSVAEIYASQILEHFPHVRTKSVLEEWYRILAPGGSIAIGVPDFARTIEIYNEIGLTDWVMNFLYGDQIYDLAYHYRPFTFASLAELLNKVGFRNIRRIGSMPYGIKDCSALRSTVDGKCVSLNVEAMKL